MLDPYTPSRKHPSADRFKRGARDKRKQSRGSEGNKGFDAAARNDPIEDLYEIERAGKAEEIDKYAENHDGGKAGS